MKLASLGVLATNGWRSGIRQRIPCLLERSAKTAIELPKEKRIRPFRVRHCARPPWGSCRRPLLFGAGLGHPKGRLRPPDRRSPIFLRPSLSALISALPQIGFVREFQPRCQVPVRFRFLIQSQIQSQLMYFQPPDPFGFVRHISLVLTLRAGRTRPRMRTPHRPCSAQPTRS
jgi:hypothetical protein